MILFGSGLRVVALVKGLGFVAVHSPSMHVVGIMLGLGHTPCSPTPVHRLMLTKQAQIRHLEPVRDSQVQSEWVPSLCCPGVGLFGSICFLVQEPGGRLGQSRCWCLSKLYEIGPWQI